MRLCKPSYEIYEQAPGIDDIYKVIERAGKTCYKSENTITEDSAKGFVDRMIASKHYAMLEHGTVYLKITKKDVWEGLGDNWVLDTYGSNPYSSVGEHYGDYFITTNYRVLVENGWLDDLQYLCEPIEYHEKRITVRFTTDRGVSHEFVRHRVFSFAQESTRYCNYSKDKFGNEITFIIPSCGYNKSATYNGVDEFDGDYFEHFLRDSESYYFKLLELGWKPQQARQVLPNALKTELVMTGFVQDWQHFFRLRTSIIAETGKPHPDASTLADPLYKEFIERGYMEPLV